MKKTMSVLMCVVMLLTVCSCSKKKHEHDWEPADCTSPKTCKECGEEKGKPLGHQWEDATCDMPKTCSECGETEGDPLGHQWNDATCTSAKTCAVCGATEGEALGHQWNDATCTSAKTCAVCGATEGDPLGHQADEWATVKSATCTEEGEEKATCSVCGEEVTRVVEKIPHEEGDWEIETEATYFSLGFRVKKCKACGEQLAKESYSLSDEEALKWLKKNAQSGMYEKISRDPDQYKGQYVKFSGRVLQVCEESDSPTKYSTYRIATDGYGDVIFACIDTYGKPRILEDDRVTVYGVCDGLMSYESVMGEKITIPLIYVAEYE